MCLPWDVDIHENSELRPDGSCPAPAEPGDVWARTQRLLHCDFIGERAQLEHAERRLLTLAVRLASSQTEISIVASGQVAGLCRHVGQDFCVVFPRVSTGSVTCVLFHAIEAVTGLSEQTDCSAEMAVDEPVVSWLQRWLDQPVQVTMLSGRHFSGVLRYLYRDHLVVCDREELSIAFSKVASIKSM